MKKHIALLLLFSATAAIAATVAGFQDWQLRGSTPASPAAGTLRIWADSTAAKFRCLSPTGAPCYFDSPAAPYTYVSPLVTAPGLVSNQFAGVPSGNLTLAPNVGGLPAAYLGTFNTGFGFTTMPGLTIGYGNTAMGGYGLSSVTTGFNNSALGVDSLRTTVDGSNNTAMGAQSLKMNVSGTNNSAFGSAALFNNTGNGNTAVGNSAMNGNLAGANNTAVGLSALQGNTTGQQSVAIGNAALSAATADNANTAVGNQALQFLNGGQNNVAIGSGAAAAHLTGNYGTFVGSSSFASHTGGANNVGIGYASGTNNLTGTGNVFIGFAACYYETGSSVFCVDNATRANQADGRIKAMFWGQFNAVRISQSLAINATVSTVTVQTDAYAVASLPTCNTAAEGKHSGVTDSNVTFTAGIGATVAGGGTNHAPVYCDGTNWKIG
jgi:hypothetical protein